MKVLLDTCEFLWFVSGDPRLPESVADIVRDPANHVYLSVVSFWEISVKHGLGKLQLPEPPALFVPYQRDQHCFLPLALDEEAVARLGSLPNIHRDPFDRMLVCQAQAHGLTLASSDPLVRQYPVSLI